MIRLLLCAALMLCMPAAFFAQPPAEDDVLLAAMRAELNRARQLQLEDLDRPYYIEYAVHDTEMLYASATMGSLADSRVQRARLPRVRVRVGDYDFDNGNYIYSDSMVGTAYSLSAFPIDDRPLAIRRHLWLVTDLVYKSALQVIARKRAAVKNVTVAEVIPDFSRAEPVKIVQPLKRLALDRAASENLVRRLSLALRAYPALAASGVELQISTGGFYFVNTEGTEVRIPENLVRFQVRATAQAPDGMALRDGANFLGRDTGELPTEEDLLAAVRAVGTNLTSLKQAPVGENYTGPVLFEPLAAAQLLADMFGRNLGHRRRPIAEPGRALSFAESELEGRIGSRILPEWMDIVDDPSARDWNGKPLLGQYPVDLEGVVPKPLTIVESGILKTLLSTRQPTKNRTGSNGRARLYGNFAANAASFGNLIVKTSQTASWTDLTRRLAQLCADRGKPYGLLVRKMDFPSTASGGEFQRMASRMAQSGGTARMVSQPLLLYRVYPDGREELVRGMRFRDLNFRSLRDIAASGGDAVVFSYLENGAPMALMGATSIVAESSVVAPGLLFEELQLERTEEDLPRLPIVPPPPVEPTS